jgi:hypothetical protein
MTAFLASTASIMSRMRYTKSPGCSHKITELLVPKAAGCQDIYEPAIEKQRPFGAAFYITETPESTHLIGIGAAREDTLIDTEILTIADSNGDVIARASFQGMLIEGIRIDWIQPPPENYYMRIVFITGADAEFDIVTAIDDYRGLVFQES